MEYTLAYSDSLDRFFWILAKNSPRYFVRDGSSVTFNRPTICVPSELMNEDYLREALNHTRLLYKQAERNAFGSFLFNDSLVECQEKMVLACTLRGNALELSKMLGHSEVSIAGHAAFIETLEYCFYFEKIEDFHNDHKDGRNVMFMQMAVGQYRRLFQEDVSHERVIEKFLEEFMEGTIVPHPDFLDQLRFNLLYCDYNPDIFGYTVNKSRVEASFPAIRGASKEERRDRIRNQFAQRSSLASARERDRMQSHHADMMQDLCWDAELMQVEFIAVDSRPVDLMQVDYSEASTVM